MTKRDFEVLLELALDEYLKEDIKDMLPHVILSVCNSGTAAKALTAIFKAEFFYPAT
ncbi:hypothetical protein [Gillisia sp. JM1]|uniref:hypothetical protein n=1 Tax=Gillisia sp. JM1 TaxID=1283286 RepID=UPI0012DE28D6|nr:hypothetical protein [Gillisia sp. JM1]